MKKLILVLGFLPFTLAQAQESQSDEISQMVSSVVSEAVSSSKNFIKGVQDGFEAGNKEDESLKDAVIINTQDLFEEHVKASVLSISKQGDEYKVTVGLKNISDKTIKLTNLNDKASLQLLDQDGFAVFSSKPIIDISIPRKVAIKQKFTFPIDGTPDILKIYDSEINIPNKALKFKDKE